MVVQRRRYFFDLAVLDLVAGAVAEHEPAELYRWHGNPRSGIVVVVVVPSVVALHGSATADAEHWDLHRLAVVDVVGYEGGLDRWRWCMFVVAVAGGR